MLFLFGCIILTSFLTLWFKVLERLKISTMQVIVYNYFTCVITGSIVNNRFPVDRDVLQQGWFIWALAMGIVFILLFNLIGFAAQRIGVAATSVANKLSLVIPFIFSIYLYDEKATVLKIAGVIVALVSVILTCWPQNQVNATTKKASFTLLIGLTAVIFFSSGLLDTMIKYVEHSFLNDENKNDYLVTAFTSASAAGVILLAIIYISGKERFDAKAILAGIALGIPNYFSIWCLVQVLKQYGDNSSAIIPINNMGIVLFSTIAAWLLFKEKLSPANWIGILLSLVAIALIAYG